MGEPIHSSLRSKKLLPNTHLLDSGYIEAKWIVESAKVEDIKVIGPVRPNNQWQSKSKNGFALSDFSIDWQNKRVTCPAGHTTASWYRRKQTRRGKYSRPLQTFAVQGLSAPNTLHPFRT